MHFKLFPFVIACIHGTLTETKNQDRKLGVERHGRPDICLDLQ